MVSYVLALEHTVPQMSESPGAEAYRSATSRGTREPTAHRVTQANGHPAHPDDQQSAPHSLEAQLAARMPYQGDENEESPQVAGRVAPGRN